ncbi:MAG: trypsin-like peptidase domain-containing protein [Limisphaerales bacterium]
MNIELTEIRRSLRSRWTGWWLVGALAATGLEAADPDPDVRRDPTVEAVARVMPSVVNIATEELVPVNDPFGDLLQEFFAPDRRPRRSRPLYSVGSGVIVDEEIDADGQVVAYVLTNDHVVRRANRVWIKLTGEAGGKEYEAEVVRGTSRTDVALLRIKAEPGERFQAVRFGADDDLLLGETVVALGNPFGLGGSVSRGILSSKSRRPPVENVPLDLEDWLQTDAAINPGNSGGPLINLRGELIGLNVAMFRQGQGIGFAIPIKRVTAALSDIVAAELNQFWFGARVRAGSPPAISSVEPGSPAERAGLQPGDLIVSANGRRPEGYLQFIRTLGDAGDREDVALVVERGGQRVDAKVRLVKESTVFNAASIRQKIGLSLQEITPDLAAQFDLFTRQGLLVAAVDRDSAAEAAGFRRGQIVQGIDGGAVDDVVSAAKVLYGRRKGDKVSLQILVHLRRGNYVFQRPQKVELTVR